VYSGAVQLHKTRKFDASNTVSDYRQAAFVNTTGFGRNMNFCGDPNFSAARTTSSSQALSVGQGFAGAHSLRNLPAKPHLNLGRLTFLS